ncbi:MAG TPA: DoxX family protein [Thermomicrobiales bacterium]|nr:DoxX family protein [Thermomicrobiales bacterium]
MQSGIRAIATTRATIWAARAMSGLAALFIIVDGAMKLFAPTQVVEAMNELGYPERLTTSIGILAIAVTAVYLYPRTAVLGAVLLTGFLGGAVASQLRAEAGLFPIVFPILIGALAWAGLYLRDKRARMLFQA